MNTITPGTQRQSRVKQVQSAAKKLGLELYDSNGKVNKDVLNAVYDVVGRPGPPKNNLPAGGTNKFGGRMDFTA